MRLLALAFLVIGNLIAVEASAEDVAVQPLTRADCAKAAMVWDANAKVCVANSGPVLDQPLTKSTCDEAGMSWDENAHVCRSAQHTETLSKVSPSQPLTRKDCESAGMTWNDTANVCDATSESSDFTDDKSG